MPDDRTRAMDFDHPEFIPVSVSLLPSAWIKHREALEEIVLAAFDQRMKSLLDEALAAA